MLRGAVSSAWFALALWSCAGRSTTNETGSGAPASAAAGGGEGGQSEEFGPGKSDGGQRAPANVDGESASGAAAVAGAGATGADGESTPVPDLCDSMRDCVEGASCIGIPDAKQRACLVPCSIACASGRDCLRVERVPLGCVASCEWPWDCPFAFDCVAHEGKHDYVCVPSQWSTQVD